MDFFSALFNGGVFLWLQELVTLKNKNERIGNEMSLYSSEKNFKGQGIGVEIAPK
ncbi:hypothetical protein KSI01_28450 [Kurthia sibirica]|nr:hypothetical protein KSI01_28450 [Kurthia sibirica]